MKKKKRKPKSFTKARNLVAWKGGKINESSSSADLQLFRLSTLNKLLSVQSFEPLARLEEAYNEMNIADQIPLKFNSVRTLTFSQQHFPRREAYIIFPQARLLLIDNYRRSGISSQLNRNQSKSEANLLNKCANEEDEACLISKSAVSASATVVLESNSE